MDLFSQLTDDQVNEMHVRSIDGLSYYPEVITHDEERSLIAHIDCSDWIHDLSRRVQHYGYRYDYRARSLDSTSSLGPMPGWITELGEKLCRKGVLPFSPAQAIVNEYQPGQGIAPHIDCEPCFGSTIASLSLASAIVMDFRHAESALAVPILLQRRSLVIMSGPARYDWSHSIAARKSDGFNGQKLCRERRLSITFRTVLFG